MKGDKIKGFLIIGLILMVLIGTAIGYNVRNNSCPEDKCFVTWEGEKGCSRGCTFVENKTQRKDCFNYCSETYKTYDDDGNLVCDKNE